MEEQKKEVEIKKQEEAKRTPAHAPTTDINKVPQKKNVLIIILLSIITLGIYPALWYMRKADEFDNLSTQKRLNKKLPTLLLIIHVILLALIIIFPLTITTAMGEFYQYMTPLQQAILAGIVILAILETILCIIISIKSRTIINQAITNKNSLAKTSLLFTVIFNYLYLQYEINRVIDDKEQDKRIAPWVFFILIILLILSSFFNPFL